MLDFLFIFDFIISIGAAIGAILILQEILKNYDIQWIRSYQYYLILASVYGVFAILGTAFTRNLLELLEINKTKIETIVLVFPLLGIPVIFTAWFMYIKLCREILQSQTRVLFTFLYFGLLILFFLIYGIRITSLAGQSISSLNKFIESFKLIIIAVKLISLFIALIPLYLRIKTLDQQFSKQFILQLTGTYFIIQVFILLLFFYIELNPIMIFIFMFLYFAGELLPVFLIYKYFKEHKSLFIDTKTDSIGWKDFLTKYQISNRESEIVEQICLGKSNKEISETLFITLQTVKDHIHNIFIKTDIKNRVQLSNLAGDYLK